MKTKRGRPSGFCPKVAREIFNRMAEGEAVTKICDAPGMPGYSTVKDWIRNDVGGFRGLYQAAQEAQQWHFLDKMMEIADREPRRTAKGCIDPADVQVTRLKTDAIKWILATRFPAVFGSGRYRKAN